MKHLIIGFLFCVAIAWNACAQSPGISPAASPAVVADRSPAISLTAPAKEAPSLEKDPASARSRPDSIYSALVLATNVEVPTQPVAELAAFAPRLKNVFGYNHLELIGSHTELMDDPDEHWLVPSKIFSLSIKSKREKTASYLLNLQLFQETKMLTAFDAKLGTQCPIFIRGPLYGKGQLVIVVIVK